MVMLASWKKRAQYRGSMPKKTSRPIQKTALRQKAEKLYSEKQKKENPYDNCHVSVWKRQIAEYIKNMRELKFQKGG